jgi:hypothetical protein
MQDFTTALKSQNKGPRTAAALPHKEHPEEQNIVKMIPWKPSCSYSEKFSC